MDKQDAEDLKKAKKWFKKNVGKCDGNVNICGCGGSGGAIYGLGFVGALIFFIGNATTFWMGVLGVLQAIVWPAYLVYEALGFFIK